MTRATIEWAEEMVKQSRKQNKLRKYVEENKLQVYLVTPYQIDSKLVENSKGSVTIGQSKMVKKGYLMNLRRSQHSSDFAAPVSAKQVHWGKSKTAKLLGSIMCSKIF